MQDIHTIGGGGARFFGGGGGDRRLRPNNQHNIQALKCPRCDSINTKFCYYNNYNLSQPRHFCKSCRRYWTKGGVLRNVPVGGGCRKSKRSKPRSNTTTTTATTVVVDGSEEPKSNSHSSSESSSLTATTTAAAANNTGTTSSSTVAAAAEVVSASSSNVSSSMFLNFSESNFFVPSTTNNTFDHHHQPSLIDHTTEGQMFQDIGNYTSLIPPSNDPRSFNMAEIPGWNHQESKMDMETDHVKMEQLGNGSGFMSQTSRIELSGLQQNKVNNNSELCSLDWQIGGGGEHGLYDLTGTVDQAYWSQTQWGENDQSLNFLP